MAADSADAFRKGDPVRVRETQIDMFNKERDEWYELHRGRWVVAMRFFDTPSLDFLCLATVKNGRT